MGILDVPVKQGVLSERLRDLTPSSSPADKVMASPPTVTVVGPITSNFTGISSSKLYSLATLIAAGSPVTWQGGVASGVSLVNSAQFANGPFVMEFMLLDSVFELLCAWDTTSNSGATIRIKVNDEYVSTTPICPTPAVLSSNFSSVRVNFATVDMRKITVELSSVSLSRLYTSVNGGVWPTQTPTDRVAILGDSFTAGSIARTPSAAFWSHLCRIMRWGEPWALGQGGTGYLNPSATTGYQKFLDRLPNVASSGATTLVIAGGFNDKPSNNAAYTSAALQAAVTALLAALPTSCPAVRRVYVVGPWQPNGSPSAELTAAALAVKTAAQAAPNVTAYIDTTGAVTGIGWGNIPPPVQTLVPTLAASGGTFTAGTYYYVWTANTSRGETTASNEQSATVVNNGTITTYIAPDTFATTYNVYRGTTPGGETVKVASAISATTFVDTGVAGSAATPPTTNTSGNVAGTGTAELITGPDSIHPIDDGHKFWGYWIARGIKAALATSNP